MKYYGVRNLSFANDEKTFINMEVIFEEGGSTWLPFSACKTDPAPHGRKLYEEALEGIHGKIEPYVPTEAQLRYKSTISFTEFRSRFTKDELIAIRTATMEIPELFIAWEDIQLSGDIVLIDEELKENMNLFYTHKIFTKKRIGEILKV